MLKIVYPICCGLDVHRDFVYACIATTENGVTTYKSHRFSTFTKGLRDLLSWLLQNNCKDVCMESTGKYWIPVYNILETDCKIVLAHPKYVKAMNCLRKCRRYFKQSGFLFKLQRNTARLKRRVFNFCIAYGIFRCFVNRFLQCHFYLPPQFYLS